MTTEPLGEWPPPQGDPIYRIWLPESPWRPPLPAVPSVDFWECNVCGATGCPVPGTAQLDGGAQHVMEEHPDVVAAMAAEQVQQAERDARRDVAPLAEVEMDGYSPDGWDRAENEDEREQQAMAAGPEDDPLPGEIPDEAIQQLVDTEKMRESIRQISRSLQPAVAELVAEGWSEAQAREIVMALFLKGIR